MESSGPRSTFRIGYRGGATCPIASRIDSAMELAASNRKRFSHQVPASVIRTSVSNRRPRSRSWGYRRRNPQRRRQCGDAPRDYAFRLRHGLASQRTGHPTFWRVPVSDLAFGSSALNRCEAIPPNFRRPDCVAEVDRGLGVVSSWRGRFSNQGSLRF